MCGVSLNEAVTDRVTTYLRRWRPTNTAKETHKILKGAFSERCIQGLLGGQPPSGRLLWSLVHAFGADFLQWIAMPAIQPDERADLDARLERLEADLRSLRADLVATDRDRHRRPVAATYAPGGVALTPGQGGESRAHAED